MTRPSHTRRRSRGITLIEVMICLVIVAIVTGGLIGGLGIGMGSARLKRSSVTIAGAVRIAYAHANSTSKTVRLVFDFDERMVVLEESETTLQLKKNDKTGGAQASTELEKQLAAEAEQILAGPKAPKAAFTTAKAFGWSPDADKPGKELETSIRFLQVETAHQDEAANSGRAYLYFWPGGQTERAAIQVVLASGDDEPTDEDVMTIVVSPLTGKAQIKKGRVSLVRPENETEESEREDSGF